MQPKTNFISGRLAFFVVALAFFALALPMIVTPTASPPGTFTGYYVLRPVISELPSQVAVLEPMKEQDSPTIYSNVRAPYHNRKVLHRVTPVDRAATDLGARRSPIGASNYLTLAVINGTP